MTRATAAIVGAATLTATAGAVSGLAAWLGYTLGRRYPPT